MNMMRESERDIDGRHHSLCVVGWQSAPPEATAVIKAVIEWTHIFISYWFISNSPLISGGHHRTVAFLLPRLRSSAPPDITVVITALPPHKLFTVSYRSKNWMSILEEKSRRKEEREEKTLTEREKSKTARLSPTGVRSTARNYNGCEQLPLCYFSLNCQSARSVQSSGCAPQLWLLQSAQTFPQKVRGEKRRVITSTSDWADDSTSSETNLEDNAWVRKHKLTVHYTLLADSDTSPVHCTLWVYHSQQLTNTSGCVMMYDNMKLTWGSDCREVYVHTGPWFWSVTDMTKHM